MLSPPVPPPLPPVLSPPVPPPLPPDPLSAPPEPVTTGGTKFPLPLLSMQATDRKAAATQQAAERQRAEEVDDRPTDREGVRALIGHL